METWIEFDEIINIYEFSLRIKVYLLIKVLNVIKYASNNLISLHWWNQIDKKKHGIEWTANWAIRKIEQNQRLDVFENFIEKTLQTMSLNNNILVVNFFFEIILRASGQFDFSAFIAMLFGISFGIFADEASCVGCSDNAFATANITKSGR